MMKDLVGRDWFFRAAIMVLCGLVPVLAFNFFRSVRRSLDNEIVGLESGSNALVSLQSEMGLKVPLAPELLSELPTMIDFQATIDAWAAATPGNKSVVVYDLEREQVVGSLAPRQDYNMMSLYKLFVAYEGYRRVENGIWRLDDKVAGRTRAECLDIMIRESDSVCAEVMRAEIGWSQLDQIVEQDYKILNSRISRLNSNVRDVAKIMKMFYEHLEFSDSNWERVKDSMLNQPCVNNGLCVGGCCDWRQGLPRGFSKRARVYNKVGWSWGDEAWKMY